jgi:hypothetical protein
MEHQDRASFDRRRWRCFGLGLLLLSDAHGLARGCDIATFELVAQLALSRFGECEPPFELGYLLIARGELTLQARELAVVGAAVRADRRRSMRTPAYRQQEADAPRARQFRRKAAHPRLEAPFEDGTDSLALGSTFLPTWASS